MLLYKFESMTKEEVEAAGFELHKEEYADESDNQEATQPSQRWFVINEVYIENPLVMTILME